MWQIKNSSSSSMSKCSNYPYHSQSKCRRRGLPLTDAELRVMRAEVRYKQLNMTRHLPTVYDKKQTNKKRVKRQTLIFRNANFYWPFQISRILMQFIVSQCRLHRLTYKAVFSRHDIKLNVYLCLSSWFHVSKKIFKNNSQSYSRTL